MVSEVNLHPYSAVGLMEWAEPPEVEGGVSGGGGAASGAKKKVAAPGEKEWGYGGARFGKECEKFVEWTERTFKPSAPVLPSERASASRGAARGGTPGPSERGTTPGKAVQVEHIRLTLG